MKETRRVTIAEDAARPLILEAGSSAEALIAKLQAALSAPGPRVRTCVLCPESRREGMPELSRRFPAVEILYFESDAALERMAATVESGAVAFLPAVCGAAGASRSSPVLAAAAAPRRRRVHSRATADDRFGARDQSRCR